MSQRSQPGLVQRGNQHTSGNTHRTQSMGLSELSFLHQLEILNSSLRNRRKT